jgi:hypothetical protein
MRGTILDQHLLERKPLCIFSPALIDISIDCFSASCNIFIACYSYWSREREIGGFVCTSRMNSLIMAEKWTTHMRVAKNGAPQLYAVGLSLGTFFGALTYRRLAGWAGEWASWPASDHAMWPEIKLLYFGRCENHSRAQLLFNCRAAAQIQEKSLFPCGYGKNSIKVPVQLTAVSLGRFTSFF